MTTEDAKGIWIVTDETDETVTGSRGMEDIGASYTYDSYEKYSHSTERRSHVSAAELKQNVGEFLEVVEEAFDRAEQSQSKMQLDELELSVEINGEGKVSLLGTGGKAGGKGAIKLKFKRK